MTTRVRGVDGVPVRPAARFADLLAEMPSDDSPLAMEARRNYQPVAGITRDAVAALAVFTGRRSKTTSTESVSSSPMRLRRGHRHRSAPG